MSQLRKAALEIAAALPKGDATRRELLKVLAYGETPEELAALELAASLIEPLLRQKGFTKGRFGDWERVVEDDRDMGKYQVVKFQVNKPSKGYRKGLHIQFGPMTVRGWVGAPDKIETRNVDGKLLAKKFKSALKKSEKMGWTQTIR